ncbi:AraC family transcriptional regulator [Lysinibacillus sp. NPDC056185]|uniref:helix-turn-helix transcriptional regulator n=1 Tax=Lysinibacillus sp. NPDC056185 TaxID=3345739 RepID=UPI0039EE93F1
MKYENYNRTWKVSSLYLQNDVSTFAIANLLYVQEMGDFSTFRPYFTERQEHDSFLILWTIKGQGHLLYEDELYTLEAGDVFWIDCYQYHKYWCSINRVWDFQWIHVQGQSMRGYYSLFRQFTKSPLISLQLELFKGAFQNILMIRKESRMCAQLREIRTHKVLTEWMTQILELYLQQGEPKAKVPDYLQEVHALLTTQYAEHLSLYQLEQQFAISRFTLIRQFKQYYGMTPNAYLILRRMIAAESLLQETALSVQQIGERVGVFHTGHFIRLFKRYKGLTPETFRQSL